MAPKGNVAFSLKYRHYICYHRYPVHKKNIRLKDDAGRFILAFEPSKTIYVYVGIYIEMRS
jgi:hypothetical protein